MKMNVARLTAQVARIHGDREALVNIERGRRFTIRELDCLGNRIVNMMRDRLDLRRQDRYLCILDNDNLALMHAWTALKGEAAGTWANYRDTVDEHLWQLDFIAPKAVFIENALLDRYYPALRERGVDIVCMDPLTAPLEGVRCFWDLLEGVSAADPGIESDIHNDPLVMRFTGGTTGRSRCAQYTIDNWLALNDAFLSSSEPLFEAGTRILLMAPISHGSGLGLLPTFLRGGCVVTQNVPDLKAWRRNVEAERITASLLVPTLLYRLLETEDGTAHDLSTLKTVFYGAAPMSPAKLRLLQARFGNVFVQIYGSTECIQPAGLLQKSDHVGDGEAAAARLGSAGRTCGGVEIMIVDETGQEVADGEHGEIWMRGRGTILGYWGNAEASAADFQDGFWKSGDIGYRDAEGYLFIVDRKKDMMISGGFNVYAVEVENALNTHPAVLMSAVVGIPHEEWGEAVHAEVVLRAGEVVAELDLIAHVKALLSPYKTPKSITFVTELPLTPVQKVLRRAVRAKYWSGATRGVN